MKHPRDLLLERHRAAGPKLDSVRRRVVEGLGRSAPSRLASRRELPGATAFRFIEVLFPFRRHLAGLGAAWAVIVLLHLAGGSAPDSAPAPGVAQTQSPSPREVLMSLREHRRRLLEWINPAEHEPSGVPQAGTPRRPTEPGRRTEIA